MKAPQSNSSLAPKNKTKQKNSIFKDQEGHNNDGDGDDDDKRKKSSSL